MFDNFSTYGFLGVSCLTFALTACLIALQKRFSLAQYIRPQGPQSHLEKKSTPTGGGLAIIVGQVVFFAGFFDHLIIKAYLSSLCLFGFLGLLDDLKKLFSEGISARLKFLCQCFIAIYILSLFIHMHYPFNLVFTQTVLPFVGKVFIPPVLLVSLNFLAHIATSNATNLTDGQDGLLAQILLTLWGSLALFGFLFLYTHPPMPGSYPIEPFILIALANLSTLGAFFCFNHFRAQIFMGDCGSLALGGSLATCATMMLYPFGLFLLAFIPLIETLSVIIQVLSFKTRRKRVFKMAPLHHHFELSGQHESTITHRFTCINTFMVILGLATYFNTLAGT